MKRIIRKLLLFGVIFTLVITACACQKQQSALYNKKINKAANIAAANTPAAEDNSEDEFILPTREAKKPELTPAEVSKNAVIKDTATYNCDIEKDKKEYEESSIDIVVGDKYYATQINDWYENFPEYEGKTVEIEGYYIDYSPYSFIGRFGPSCPYCQGGYVCFEFLTNEDLSAYTSDSDWIKVKGILRRGNDSAAGEFYYIEAMSLEKMDKIGMDTVTD